MARILKTRKAFMLIDAVMGIVICAVGLGLAFGFIYTLTPQNAPLSYRHYLQLLSHPISNRSIKLGTNEGLVYVLDERGFKAQDNEYFLYYEPKAIE